MTRSAEQSLPAHHQLGWHRAECWGYTADLPLWRELAGDHRRRILDLGCGAGRVALDLSAHGHDVTGLDHDPVLLAALAESDSAITTVEADARDFRLNDRFDLVLAPMQTLQLLTEPDARHSCLFSVRRHLADRSRFAAAFVEVDLGAESTGRNLLEGEPVATDFDDIEPDLLAASSSIGLHFEAAGRLKIRRRRELYRRSSERPFAGHEVEFLLALLSREEIEAEFAAAGLTMIEWRSIAPTANHMGAVVAIAAVACQSA